MDYGKLLGLYGKLIAQCTDPLELQRLEKEKEEIFEEWIKGVRNYTS
jgi:hypothetical protein